MKEPPKLTAPISDWIKWVDEVFPFDLSAERKLSRRLVSEKPMCGSRQELEDLRGVADPINLMKPDEARTRIVAAVLARMWFQMRERERKVAWHAAQMNSRQAEKELADFDESIGAERYEQGNLYE